MHLSNCLHPKVITNPYTKEKVSVPCGECDVCRNNLSLRWVARLEAERCNTRHTWFITLTYANEFLPYADYRGFSFNKRKWLKKDFDYYNSLGGVIPALSVPDAQKFIKRLRYYIKKELPYDKQAKIRYYLVGEYGSTLYRPHYHALLFTQSDKVSEILPDLVRKAWTFGRIDVQSVQSSATSYVAGYINTLADLPAIYKDPSIKPFSIKSIAPPLGFAELSEEQIQEIFYSSAPEMSVYSSKDNQIVDVPLWRSLQSRLFPRLPLYSQFTDCDRRAIYRFVYEEVSKEPQYRAFIERARRRALQKEKDDLISVYLRLTSHEPIDLDVLIEPKFSNFRFIYYVGRALIRLTKKYNISIDDVITLIFKYYENKSSYLLKKQLQYEQEFVLENDVRNLVHLDKAFYDSVVGVDYFSLTPEQKSLLFSFGYSPTEIYFGLDAYTLEDTFDFINMRSSHTAISNKKKKVKICNDFLNSRRFNINNYRAQLRYNNHIKFN